MSNSLTLSGGAYAVAVTITTYSELETYIRQWRKHLDLIIIEGWGGTGKTELVKKVWSHGDDVNVDTKGGRLSGWSLYKKLYETPDGDFCIDDVDQLWNEKDAVSVLKAASDTGTVKTISWHTRNPEIKSGEIPDHFDTTSKFLFISNKWKLNDPNARAFANRGVMLKFHPTHQEVHRAAGEWFTDKEVYQWFGENGHYCREPNFRDYKTASKLRQTGAIEFRAHMLREWDVDESDVIVVELAQSGLPAREQEREFVRRTGKSRATFFNRRTALGLSRSYAGKEYRERQRQTRPKKG
jgi:hypothetical protein